MILALLLIIKSLLFASEAEYVCKLILHSTSQHLTCSVGIQTKSSNKQTDILLTEQEAGQANISL